MKELAVLFHFQNCLNRCISAFSSRKTLCFHYH